MDIQNPINKTELEKKLFCTNCGKYGHISKKCLCPIISVGIICIKINLDNFDINTLINYTKKIQNNYIFNNEEINKIISINEQLKYILESNFNNIIQYLMIRRKNSLNYVEFMRGKYDINNLDYLIKSFNFITQEEKNQIKNNTFEKLWSDLWGQEINNNQSSEYIESRDKFNLLKNGFIIKKNDININISLDILLKESIYNYFEPEWGFPKGRRNLKEKNIECAKREFEEETLIPMELINILNMTPMEEIYIASNGLKYKHIYYISQIKDKNFIIKLDVNNIEQQIEIGDLKWCYFNEALLLIREYNIEKKNILLTLYFNLKYLIENSYQLINDFFKKIK
jgi:8-oxo-dGTP pyrophosphatase MutT (NUDIX family)